MKHFLVEITYTIPVEQLGELVTEHRAYIKTGFDKGMILMSGPQSPRLGGIVIARSETKEEIELFFLSDPYALHKAAEYRFVEFVPLMHQAFLTEWVSQ